MKYYVVSVLEMVKIKISVVFLIASSLSSCTTYYYAPLPLANPMFTEKGEMQVQGGVNLTHIQGQYSWSPLKNASFTYGFSKVHPSAGMGSSHGLRLQHYGRFRSDYHAYYQLGLGFEIGSLHNTYLENQSGFIFPAIVVTAISRYSGPSLNTGVYWDMPEHHTRFGVDLEVTSARYAFLEKRTYHPDSTGSPPTSHLYNRNEPINKVIYSASLSSRYNSPNGRYFLKASIGIRKFSAELELYNMNPDYPDQKQNTYFTASEVIFSIHLGINLHNLNFKKR